MPTYAVKVGEMKVISARQINAELRALMLKAVSEALANMDGELGDGCKLVFEVAKA